MRTEVQRPDGLHSLRLTALCSPCVLAHQHTGGISGGRHSGRAMEVLRKAGRNEPEPQGVLLLLQPAELPEGRPPGPSTQSVVQLLSFKTISPLGRRKRKKKKVTRVTDRQCNVL